MFLETVISINELLMGIPLLNKLIKENHLDKPQFKALEEGYLKDLEDKTVVIDTLIYLYRFKGEDLLYERVYEMCNIFHYYRINAVFIFDGKIKYMNQEKKKERYKMKGDAKDAYNTLYHKMTDLNTTKEDYKTATYYREKMKTHVSTKTTLSIDECKCVRMLIRLFGYKCIRSDTEADVLCCYYVNQGKAYGCFTEDMDLLVYGCQRIFKYFSLLKHNYISYEYDRILNMLGLSPREFREMCVLSSSEYKRTKYNVYFVFKTIKKYGLQDTILERFKIHELGKGNIDQEYIQSEYDELEKINRHYQIENHPYLKYFDEFSLDPDMKQEEEIQKMMYEFNFIFV